jgi:hypothetical protein
MEGTYWALKAFVHFVNYSFGFQALAADKEENGSSVEIGLSTGDETPTTETDRTINCVRFT